MSLHYSSDHLTEVVIVVECAILTRLGFHVDHQAPGVRVPDRLHGRHGRREAQLQKQQDQSQPTGALGAVTGGKHLSTS